MKFLSFLNASLLAVVFFTIGAAAQTTFTNSTAITINDNATANPYPSNLTISGLSGTISNAPGSVKVRLNSLNHTYSADVGILLVGPTGAAFLIQDFAGDDVLSNITYTLSDDGEARLPFNGAWANGTYKPTAFAQDNFPAPAPGTSYGNPGPDASGTATFSSVFGGTNPNGVWKLYIADFGAGDTGSVSGGWSLTITTSGGVATANNVNVDFNKDGKTDWFVLRPGTINTSATEEQQSVDSFSNGGMVHSFRERRKRQQEMLNGTAAAADLPLFWLGGTNTFPALVEINNRFGSVVSDTPIPEDFDGDGKDDIAVWRSGKLGEAGFYIIQSTNNVVRSVQLGQDGDDPTVTGDYDGDKISDPAVFHCPETSGQCYYLIVGSLNNPNKITTSVAYGFGNTFTYLASPGDFDGDGKYDFCLQRDVGNGAAQFVLKKSTNLEVENINWGFTDDIIAPGDYDGDGKADFMVVRAVNGVFHWYLLTRTGGGTGSSPIYWGYDTDYITPGDYDGDGKQDIAIWRGKPDPAKDYYHIYRSSDNKLQTFRWGSCIDAANGKCDYPLQNWYVH